MSDSTTHASGPSGSGKPAKKRGKPGVKSFIEQVIAELRKVIWPTRKELITYTGVVIVFVLIMAGIVALLDFVFTQGVLAIFGE